MKNNNNFHESNFRNGRLEIPAGTIIRYLISREEVEDGDTERLVHDLRIAEDNPLVQAGPGSLIFRVDGYDDDPRELWQIPEFLRFVRQVEEETPCWLYFAAPESGWLVAIVAAIFDLELAWQAPDGSGKILSFSTADIDLWVRRQIPGFETLCRIGGISDDQAEKAFERAIEIFIPAK